MKLYHATSNENIENILAHGLIASSENTSADYHYTRESDECGIYGFASIEDAIDFANEQSWYFEAGIFSFDSDSIVPDPEYDEGVAYIAMSNENIKADLVKINE